MSWDGSVDLSSPRASFFLLNKTNFYSFILPFASPFTFLILFPNLLPTPPHFSSSLSAPTIVTIQTFTRHASASFSRRRQSGMSTSYSSLNEEDLAENQLAQPVHSHPASHSNAHHSSYGSHNHAARTLSNDPDHSGPAATAITFSEEINNAPPSYAMDSPTTPSRTGGKQALNRFKAIANQAVAARRLSCKL